MLPSFLASSNAGLAFASNENWLSPAVLRLDAKFGGAVSEEKQNQIREIVLRGLSPLHVITTAYRVYFYPSFLPLSSRTQNWTRTGIRERHEERRGGSSLIIVRETRKNPPMFAGSGIDLTKDLNTIISFSSAGAIL